MLASVGDRIVVHGRTIDEPERAGEVLEVHGTEGAPPYLVRWEADGHVGLFFPGPDALVHHFEHVQTDPASVHHDASPVAPPTFSAPA